MTDAELHQKTTGLLAGTLPDDVAAQFRAALRDSEPLREQARLMALGLLLGERSEQLDLLQKMDGWENEIAVETPADTDTARLELLLNERQDELEMRRNMDAWESGLATDAAAPAPFPLWRWVGAIVLSALLFAALMTWICSPATTEQPAPGTPAPPSQPPVHQPQPPKSQAPQIKQPAPQPSGNQNSAPPVVRHQYIALAESIYRQSAITTGNVRSINANPPDRPPKPNSNGNFRTGLEDATVSDGSGATDLLDALRKGALTAYENRRWPEAVRLLDAVLQQLPASEKPAYLLLLGGAHFEQGDFPRAIEVFSRKALSDDPEYGYDAQRYELLSRVANLPAGKDALRQLIRSIRQDPDNPNRELAADILRKTPDL